VTPKRNPGRDFSTAPIYLMYGPSPSMIHERMRWDGSRWVFRANGDTELKQRLREKRGPRLSKGAKGKSNKEIAEESIP